MSSPDKGYECTAVPILPFSSQHEVCFTSPLTIFCHYDNMKLTSYEVYFTFKEVSRENKT